LKKSKAIHYTVVALVGFVFFWLFLISVGLLHEFGHVIAAKACGVPVYRMTPFYTLLGNILNPTAKTVIQFSGGLSGFLYSMLLLISVFFVASMLRSLIKTKYPTFAKKWVQVSRCHPWAIIEGVYVALLAHAFSQLGNAFWEGFFNSNYVAASMVSIIALFIVSGVLAMLTIFIGTVKHYNFTNQDQTNTMEEIKT